MVFGIGIGNVVALIHICRGDPQAANALWAALLAIFLFFGGAVGHRGEVKGLGRQ
jgi:hypothetical protein